MCHIFGEQVMITLVTFYAPGCLSSLKVLCEWLLEMSYLVISTITLFFVTLNFQKKFMTAVHPKILNK